MTTGIHHVTAISSNAQKTYDFYTNILGLRLVKKTVNFDSPDTYHFYFGNEKGDPGTLLTFFPFTDAGTGMRGIGQTTKIMFAVPDKSFDYWIERFNQYGVRYENIKKHFRLSTVTFYDFDGLQLELVMSNEPVESWSESIPKDKAITNIFGVELSVGSKDETQEILELLGYELIDEIENHYRFENKKASYSKFIDLFEMKGWPEGIQSAGTVHHVAFRAENAEIQEEIRSQISNIGLSPTSVVDRKYFKSVYFREPSKILFEIATDGPGMDVDEPFESLGEKLQLPDQVEFKRSFIEKILPELHTNSDKQLMHLDAEFIHRFIKGTKDYTFVLFHGSGGDENDLIPMAATIDPEFNILSLRGNNNENGMNRFFKRFNIGNFDEDSMFTEIEKLKSFLDKVLKFYNIDKNKLIFIGFSNGATFILSNILKKNSFIKNAVLLHPNMPFELKESIDLKDLNILITSGTNDEYLISEDEIENITKLLVDSSAKVEVKVHEYNHQIYPEEIIYAKEFINKL